MRLSSYGLVLATKHILFDIIGIVEEIDWRGVSQLVFIDDRLDTEDRCTSAR
jgi:hypothetical protein